MNRFDPRRLALVLVLPWLIGCASLKTENMVSDVSPENHHAATVALNAHGGSAGVQWFSGTISPDAFADAVRRSLESSRLFEQITSADAADYLLDVNLTYASSHPGFNMNAWANVTWTLVARASGATSWTAEIKGDGHATMGDAFCGAHRQFIALERAGKHNIDQALTQLGHLTLE
jgi:hypothetical protein